MTLHLIRSFLWRRLVPFRLRKPPYSLLSLAESARVTGSRVLQGSGILKSWIRSILEPIIMRVLISGPIVEKVHNPEIVRRNYEVTSMLTGQDAAQIGSRAAPTSVDEYSAQRRNLLLYSGRWPLSDSLECEMSDSPMWNNYGINHYYSLRRPLKVQRKVYGVSCVVGLCKEPSNSCHPRIFPSPNSGCYTGHFLRCGQNPHPCRITN